MKSMRSTIERTDVEEVLEILGDRSPVGVCILQEGRFCYSNPAFLVLTGYSADELEGKDFSELVIPEDGEMIREDAVDMLRGERPSPSQFTVACKDGSIRWVMQTVSSIDYRGKPATLINCMDVTERKRAEEALQKSGQFLQDMFDATQDGTSVLDADLNVIRTNGWIEQMYAHQMPLAGKKCYQAYQQRQSPCPWCPTVRTIETGETHTAIVPYPSADAPTGWIELTSFPIKDEKGNITSVIEHVKDITERKRAEEKVKATHQRLLAVFDGINALIYAADMETYEILFINQYGRSIWGDIEGDKCWRTIQSDQSAPCDFCTNRRLVDAEGNPTGVYRWEHQNMKNGRWYDCQDSAIKWIDGRTVRLEIAVDITDRRNMEEALRQSEERYRSMLEEMEDSYFEVDLGGHLTFVNSATCRNLQYSRDELLGMSYKAFTLQDDVESVFRMFNEVYRIGKPNKGFAWQIVPRDGKPWFVDTSVSALRDDRGEIVGFRGVARDITERKRAEEALKLQRSQFQQLFDNSPDAVLMLDTGDRVVQANRGFENLFGYAADEVTGQPINKLVIPRGRVMEASASSRKVLRGGVVRKEAVRRRKDGSLVDVSIVGYPIRFEGNLVGMYVIYSDVSKRKKMEEAINRAADEWTETFDSINDAVSIHSNDFRIRRVNKAFADRFGMTPRRIVGKHCYEVVHGAKEPVPGCPHRETLQTGKPAGAEFLKSDNGVCLEMTTSPIFDERGEVAGTVHIARDVTEHKQQSLQLMLTDRLASIGELAAGTAHELNNPLTSVIGFSQLLMERDVPDDIRDDLELIHSEARRAAEVTKNLLTFARKHAPVKQANRIDLIVEDVLRLRAYEHKLSNIQVKEHFAAGLPEIVVDYFQIQQVLLNLIINAEYFMTEAHNGGILTVSARRRKSTMVISVADDGPGIPQENLAQLFNPFFTTKAAGRGTGLGLSICHGIVTEHGGRIYARSQLGKGTTFFVELPINNTNHSGGTL